MEKNCINSRAGHSLLALLSCDLAARSDALWSSCSVMLHELRNRLHATAFEVAHITYADVGKTLHIPEHIAQSDGILCAWRRDDQNVIQVCTTVITYLYRR